MSDTWLCSMTQSKVKVTIPWKLEILPFSQLSPPFTMGAGNWPWLLKLRHNISIWLGWIFDICPSFCVVWFWTWQKRRLWRVDHQSLTGLIYFVLILCCSILCYGCMFSFVGFDLVFGTKPRDWLVRMSLEWPILCRVGHETLTQSIIGRFIWKLLHKHR